MTSFQPFLQYNTLQISSQTHIIAHDDDVDVTSIWTSHYKRQRQVGQVFTSYKVFSLETGCPFENLVVPPFVTIEFAWLLDPCMYKTMKH